jgi:hypothetical protein
MYGLSMRPRMKCVRAGISSKSRRTLHHRRRSTLELLEGRVVPSYTFSFDGVSAATVTQTANAGNAGDSLVLAQVAGTGLEYSVNGSAFSSMWTGGTPPNAAGVTVTVNQAAGVTGNSITIGTPGGAQPDSPISSMLPAFVVDGAPASSSLTLDDSTGMTAGTYSFNGTVFSDPTGVSTTVNSIESGGVTINGSSFASTFNALGSTLGTPVTFVGAAPSTTVNIGAPGGSGTLANITSPVSVIAANAPVILNVNDQGDTSAQTYNLSIQNGEGLFALGTAPAILNFVAADVASLTINGSGQGNTFNISDTPPDISTTINAGTGTNTVNVLATGAGSTLNIHGQGGDDSVNLGNNGDVSGILGTVFVDNTTGQTALTIDASNDPNSHPDILLRGTSLTGLTGGAVNYNPDGLSTLVIDTNGTLDQTLNIDFSAGNPIPAAGAPGLVFNAGDPAPGVSHVLNIFGTLPTGAFQSETHNANDQEVFPQVGQYGSISFVDPASVGTSLDYTGLQPVNDTTPASLYTFNDFGYPDQSYLLHDGPPVMGFPTLEFVNAATPPTPLNFETTDIANKANVVLNTPPAIPPVAGPAVNGLIDLPSGASGLSTLTINELNTGNNNVSFTALPGTVGTTYNGGNADDTTFVAGRGVASGNTLTLNGGAGTNTLNYDAGGLVPSLEPGLQPGEVLIALPGYGTVDVLNYQNFNFSDLGGLPIRPGPARTINTVEGFNLTDAIVGTFTFLAGTIGGQTINLPASDFAATIDWGDPSPDTQAATITQDASNPAVYYITGTHTFTQTGSYTVNSTIVTGGGTFTATLGNQTFSFAYAPVTSTPGTPATAIVTQGPLAVTVAPVVGTEGADIGSAQIATFIDAGGPNPATGYAASVSIVPSGGGTPITPPGPFTVAQIGTSAQYTVTGDLGVLPEEGNYQVLVTITDNSVATPFSVTAAGTAAIADATLTPDLPVALTPNSGDLLSNTVVGLFTDNNKNAPLTDFSGTIDWGDGTAPTIATFVAAATAGDFMVEGTHAYARPGHYDTTVVVSDVGGSKVTLLGFATVTDLPVTGTATTFSAVEGQNTGTLVLANITDPNPLATAASLTAQIINWGDGTPATPKPLSVVLTGGDATDTFFQVLGSHTYAEEGIGLPVSFTLTTSGGVVTTFSPTNMPANNGTANVADASLSSSGATITGIEGTATAATTLIATSTDSDPNGTIADFTTAPGSVVVNWGDGSAPETLTAANLTMSGIPDGVVFSVTAPHTYAEAGNYQITLTATDAGGATTVAHGAAVIADAKLTASAPVALTPTTGALLSNVVVGTFTDANTGAPDSDFSATIDWGDGTATSIGTVVAATPAGTFNVLGTHAYAKPGSYATRIVVTDVDGSVVNIPGTATVSDASLAGSARNFTAQEGQSTGTIVLATIDNPNTLAGVTQLTATVDWGDSTGIFTVPVTPTGGTPSDTLFQVTGSHTYAEEGVFTVKVTVTTTGGATTAPPPVTSSSPLTGTATVLDAPLTAVGSGSIQGIEGNSTGSKLVATWTDTNPGATVSDFTTGGGSVVVNWGDGTTPDTLPASAVTLTGSPSGVVFTADNAHTYAEAGSYQVTVTIDDTGGATAVAHGFAAIADAPLSAPVQTPAAIDNTNGHTITEGIPFSTYVAVFSDANPMGTISDFNYVTIDWGDGSPNSNGTIVQPGGVGTVLAVVGTHTYADSGVNGGTGSFPVIVNVHDVDGSTLVIYNSVKVADVPITLTGFINQATVVNESASGVIVHGNQPAFYGTLSASPEVDAAGGNVYLYAYPTGGGTPILMGQTEAGSDGSWSITSIALPDGTYTVTGYATDAAGQTTTHATILPSSSEGPLVIDTHGPKVLGLSFAKRVSGELIVTFSDTGGLLDLRSVQDAASYMLTKVGTSKHFLVNVISQSVNAAAGTDTVTLLINDGRQLRGGNYTFTIFAASGGVGIRDLAGNPLDGVFYGFFPSGNNAPGGSNFVALLNAVHHQIFPPATVVGHASPVVPPGTPATGTTIPTANPTLPSGNPNFHGNPSGLKSTGHRLHMRLAQPKAKVTLHDLALEHLAGRVW